MNTLEQLAENYRTHRDRNPLPVDTAALEALRKMTPQAASENTRALMADCVTYENGKPLFYAITRTGAALFARLSTREEFTNPE